MNLIHHKRQEYPLNKQLNEKDVTESYCHAQDKGDDYPAIYIAVNKDSGINTVARVTLAGTLEPILAIQLVDWRTIKNL